MEDCDYQMDYDKDQMDENKGPAPTSLSQVRRVNPSKKFNGSGLVGEIQRCNLELLG